LLLEGGDLQELLAQVREEHGSRAKIVSAERVRAGGLTGLLRAERYELTVELTDEEAEAVPVGAASDVGAASGLGAVAPGQAALASAAPAARAAIGPLAAAGLSPIEATAAGGSESGPAQYETPTAAGHATAGRSGTTNQPVYPEPAKAGNAPRPAAPPLDRQANVPAIAARPAPGNGGGGHGPEVDELLALLEQREHSAPDTSGVSGFDEVLAELRGAAASTNGINGTNSTNSSVSGATDDAASGFANGVHHGQPTAVHNGIVDSVTNGVHNGANGAATSVHNAVTSGAAANGTAHGVAPVSAQPAAAAQAQPHLQHDPQSAMESAHEAALPGALRQESSPSSTETRGFSMDPIFAPANGTPEAPPAPARASAPSQPAPPAPASAQAVSSQNVGPARATTARTTSAATRTRPLSPDPRRPNHFLSFGELETVPAESPLPQKLADLGLPQRVIDRLPLGEAYPSIVRALLDEPTAPQLPSGPGMIITITGELAGALSVAEDVARILRLDADRVLIASESPQVGRHMADPGDAGRQAARLRGGDQPRLVCIDAPGPTNWVNQVVVALRPDAVWCAVDATRKPADVARQLRSLPRVDALAVHALEATADPASPLALGVPVALLDGQQAGPHGWAALLCRRLFEEEFAGDNR
jgi:hypothetical protein